MSVSSSRFTPYEEPNFELDSIEKFILAMLTGMVLIGLLLIVISPYVLFQ